MNLRRLIGAVALCLVAGVGMGAERPERVVSMNLCTDQLAMLLAEDGQLISVSRIAADPYSSPMAEEAGAYPLNGGGAEEIYLLEPDLVLAADWSDPVAVGMLRRLGIEVVQVPIATALAEIPGQLRAAGRALGQAEKAEAMAEAAEARLAVLSVVGGDEGPVAAVYYANGYTLGTGTLGHDIIRAAGFENLAERLGRPGGGRLALETLLVEAPDILIASQAYAGASEAEALARHPALDGYFEDDRVIESGPEWVCGTPLTIRAVEELARLRLRYE